MEGVFLYIIKATYNKPTMNIFLNGENLKLILLKSGISQGCPLTPLLLNKFLEALAKTPRSKEVN